jgi:hypothetical protein
MSASAVVASFREAHLDPVRPAGEERRVHIIEGDIDPGDRGVGVEGFHGQGEQIVVVEVARVRDAVGERPDLDYAVGEEPHRPADLLTHMPTSGTRGKRGALAASPRATRGTRRAGRSSNRPGCGSPPLFRPGSPPHAPRSSSPR